MNSVVIRPLEINTKIFEKQQSLLPNKENKKEIKKKKLKSGRKIPKNHNIEVLG